ncbi:MAG TPA: NAD(P)H-dependent glycerol-3-phosphate dehydrogenase [Candidatus Thermoplasmatota archaeon]|nr:NAD(P)H-dependent glycerol-3-phosphate dehydrogenase [Candidatus Thermoplasmatota archaeon]
MSPAVLGAGSWGTTLAGLLASKGEKVYLWARNPASAEYMQAERHNPKYLPDYQFPPTLQVTSNLQEALSGQQLVIHAVPSHATREFAKEYAKYLAPDAVVVSATKGLEYGTHKRMSEVIHEATNHPVAALSGPNHAEEVSAMQPTAAVIAHPDANLAEQVSRAFSTSRFKAYPRTDLVGTEVCGAYKNVVALSTGMVDGLGWGDNALACLVTLGMDEMVALTRALGGDPRTVSGLAGVGDLVATCASQHSRNRRYGRELALGTPPEAIKRKMHGMVAEGVYAVKSFRQFAQEEKIELPLTRVVHAIVYEGLTVGQGVEMLLARI